jgi:hypothetical protein
MTAVGAGCRHLFLTNKPKDFITLTQKTFISLAVKLSDVIGG